VPEVLPEGAAADAWLRELNKDLAAIRQASDEYQKQLVADRLKDNPLEEQQNQFQPGDMVLYDSLYDPCNRRKEKLDSRYRGPYVVIRQIKDEIEARHMACGFIRKILVERCKLFIGTAEQAERLAREDADQFLVRRVLAWKGDPNTRTTMSFEVEFDDGDIVWKVYDHDLATCEAFHEFCRQNRELTFLTLTAAEAKKAAVAYNRCPITDVQPRQIIYVNLRYFSTYLYDNECTLPDKYHVKYVLPVRLTRWFDKGKRRPNTNPPIIDHWKIDAVVPLWNVEYTFNNLFVHLWGRSTQLEEGMIEITPALAAQHPDLLQFKPDLRRRRQNVLRLLTRNKGEDGRRVVS